MYDTIIRAGRLGNGQLVDIAIKHGKIAVLGSLPESTEAKQTLTLAGQVHVSAGWIDGHTTATPAPLYHDEPDKVGVASGVTTVIDAGSTGADVRGRLPADRRRLQDPGPRPAQHLPHRPLAPERAGQSR